jgi:excisionase family DNA binding protein
MHIEKGVPVTFKVDEVAKILNCSRSQVYVLMKTKELKSSQIRGSRRVTESQLVEYIRSIEG